MDGIPEFMNAHRRSDNLKTVIHIIYSFANAGCYVRDSLAVHSQMQDHRTVAAENGVEMLFIVALFGDIETVLAIDLAFANLSRQFRNSRLMQRENQNGGVLTSVNIVAEEVIGIGMVVALAAHLPEEFGTAGIHNHFGIITLVNGQMQGDHAIAACHISQRICIIARLCIGVAMPRNATAGNGGGVAVGGVIDRQMEGNDGVAT